MAVPAGEQLPHSAEGGMQLSMDCVVVCGSRSKRTPMDQGRGKLLYPTDQFEIETLKTMHGL